jgi:murein L,D-transpeptidase YcbB/YkuD
MLHLVYPMISRRMYLNIFFSVCLSLHPLFCKMQRNQFLLQSQDSFDFGSKMASRLEEKKRWILQVYSREYPDDIPAFKKNKKGADSLKTTRLVEQALILWKDLNVPEPLIVGIKRFQRRNGLDTTGKIDNTMIALLNLKADDWVYKIEINKVRMNGSIASDSNGLLWVNIPDFYLRWLKTGQVLHTYRVIVGQRDWPTREFESKVTALHIHPSWYVPPRIWEKEVRAKVQKNKNYLRQQHMVWENGKLRQLPGPWNALGKVKVVAPNRYLIFLHDTPNKSLFKKRKRMFSHGCVRVEHAERIVQHIFNEAGLGNELVFQNLLDQGLERILPVQVNIPVLVGYWTLWVDERGVLQNREDVYGWD